jgi:hypothetical protein
VINASGAVLRVQYDGKFAQDTQLNSVSLKGSVPVLMDDLAWGLSLWIETRRGLTARA